MNTIMHLDNWAHLPLMDYFDSGKFKDLPMLILYGNGEDDWMWSNVLKCHDTVNAPEPLLEKSYLESIIKNGNSTLSQSEMFHAKTSLKLIEDSGHQVMVDNPKSVNYEILKFTHDDDIAMGYRMEKIDMKLTIVDGKL